MNKLHLSCVARMFYPCVFVSLFLIPEHASAAPHNYTFSGELDHYYTEGTDCTGNAWCGPYSGMVSIDDTQVGVIHDPTDPRDTTYYVFANLKITFAGGGEITDANGEFHVYHRYSPNPTPGYQSLQKVGFRSDQSGYALDLEWWFPEQSFDLSNLPEILASLTSDTQISSLIFLNGPAPCPGCAGTLSPLEELLSPPNIDETATVSPDAEIGDNSIVGAYSVIDKSASIGESSTIGEYVSIKQGVQLGRNAEIGDGSTINRDVTAGENLTVGSNVIIGRNVSIGDNAIIGDNTRIDQYTQILSGVKIGTINENGAGVFIGQHAYIGENEVIGDGQTIPAYAVIPSP